MLVTLCELMLKFIKTLTEKQKQPWDGITAITGLRLQRRPCLSLSRDNSGVGLLAPTLRPPRLESAHLALPIH